MRKCHTLSSPLCLNYLLQKLNVLPQKGLAAMKSSFFTCIIRACAILFPFTNLHMNENSKVSYCRVLLIEICREPLLTHKASVTKVLIDLAFPSVTGYSSR